jgi:hypothetical protein
VKALFCDATDAESTIFMDGAASFATIFSCSVPDQLNTVKRGRFKVKRVGSGSQDEKMLRYKFWQKKTTFAAVLMKKKNKKTSLIN